MLERACDVFGKRAAETPQATFLIFEGSSYSFGQIQDWTERCLRVLVQLDLPQGARVLLVLHNRPEFFAWFFAVQQHGCVPVPLGPKSTSARLQAVALDCQARVLIEESPRPAGGQDSGLATLAHLAVDAFQAVEPTPTGTASRDCELAFIQYTSGSLGGAKGVQISHRAVRENVSGTVRALKLDQHPQVFSSMMPLFHDMGLVFFGLAPAFLGAPLVLYREEAISLRRWFEGFGKYKVTLSGGPNTFLRLANRLLRDVDQFDLSTLSVFVCGSEPIDPDVLREFEARFHCPGVVKPAYGMAELTLCATMTPLLEAWSTSAGGVVACGRPLENITICIETEDETRTTAPFVEGEILVRSPSALLGYCSQTATSPLTADGYVRTRDWGFLDEQGRLFVRGRTDNLIVRAGKKFSGADLEALAVQCAEVQGCMVVGVDSPQAAVSGIVAVLQVSRPLSGDAALLKQIALELWQRSRLGLDYVPDLIGFVGPGQLPTTLNGKLRHSALRQQLASGALQLNASFALADLTARVGR